MDLKNGYKKLYEVAANGTREFYASTTGICDPDVDLPLGVYVDSDYAGKTIFEFEGHILESAGRYPTYDEDGTPNDYVPFAEFDKVFKEADPGATPAATSIEDEDLEIPEVPAEEPEDENTEEPEIKE